MVRGLSKSLNVTLDIEDWSSKNKQSKSNYFDKMCTVTKSMTREKERGKAGACK
jgi:hypothetical protein